MRDEHTRAFDDALKNSDATSAEKIKQLEKMHTEALDKAVGNAQSEAQQHTSEATKQHDEALQNALAEASQKSQTELERIKGDHATALARVREEAETEHQDRLNTVKKHHEESLASFIAEVRAQTNGQSKPAGFEGSEDSSIDVMQKLNDAESRALVMSTKHESMTAELTALQARLDAELTSHAEAERSLAEIKKLNFDEDKRLASSREPLLRQIAHQQEQLERLSHEHGASTLAMRESQDGTVREAADPLPDSNSNDPESLGRRLAALEEELQAAQSLHQQRLIEKDELARQNDFLVKELEARQAQLTSSATGPKTDAKVQTDVVVSVPATPRTPNHDVTRMRDAKSGSDKEQSSPQVNGSGEAPSKENDADAFQGEQKADLPSLRSVKGKSVALQRAEPPVSPSKRLSDSRAKDI